MSEEYLSESMGATPMSKILTQALGPGRLKSSVIAAGRIPPQALDMEQAVLGALMLEKDALSRIIDVIRPEMFYKDAHREIYGAVYALFQDSQPVDILTVRNYLSQVGKLEMAGGVFYLTELTSRVASAANIEYHARVIAQKYLLRELIIMGDNVIVKAYDETSDVFELLDSTEREIFALSETNLRRNYTPMADLVHLTLKKLEELKSLESGVTGVPTGFGMLDNYTSGWQRSDLIICAARPAMGKTAFTLTVAMNAAVKYGVPVAFFSLEMASTQIAQRLLSSQCEIDAQKLRTGRLEAYEWEQLNKLMGPLSKAPLFIDDTPALSVMDLRAKARRLKAEKGIGMIIIDYLQLMTGNSGKGSNREQEIAGISRSLKELAKELDVPIIALSQLSRAVETRGGDKKPMLSDLRESGSIEQDADMVLFLYRPEYYNILNYEDGSSTAGVAEVLIAKQRNGPVGEVKLQFINRFAKFADLDMGGSGFGNQFQQNPSQLGQPKLNPSDFYLAGGSDLPGTIIKPSKMNEEPPQETPPPDDFFEGGFDL